MARFEIAAAVALAGLLAGCDSVFGLTGEAKPCEVGSFAVVTPVDVTAAEAFSFDWDETFGVISIDGSTFEIDPVTSVVTPTDLGPYLSTALSLTPEGDAIFYTANIEPPVLKGALRGNATEWRLDAGVPRGTYAGTPSADVFGPRRVLVKMRVDVDAVQEYEDVAGTWMTVSAPMPLLANQAPNLTPDGLTMVYPGFSEIGQPAVFVAQRSSTKTAFSRPTAVLAGQFSSAQLTQQCKRLYTTDSQMLRRYDR